MIEPWFDANTMAWIPGTVLGCLGGLWGSLLGIFAPQGKCKGFLMRFGALLLAASAVLLVGGIAAVATGQPYGVWYGLGFPGLLGLCVLGGLMPVAVMRYRQAELRRMQARDMR